jgi:hypothetical protein
VALGGSGGLGQKARLPSIRSSSRSFITGGKKFVSRPTAAYNSRIRAQSASLSIAAVRPVAFLHPGVVVFLIGPRFHRNLLIRQRVRGRIAVLRPSILQALRYVRFAAISPACISKSICGRRAASGATLPAQEIENLP